MQEAKLAGIFRSVAQRMRADFETSSALLHRGEAGTTRESIVCKFVSGQMPGHVQAAHSGEIVTAAGEISPQCDIVIFDRSTPPLLDLESYRIVPSECVYGVIEVKTTLDREKLLDACEKIRKVKALPKTAYAPDPLGTRSCTAYGKRYSYVPTFGIIFAFDSIDLETVAGHFTTWCAEHQPEERPDSVWILGKGWLNWTDPQSGRPAEGPEPGSGLTVFQPAWPQDDVLLPLALQLSMLLVPAWMPPFRLSDYAGRYLLGTAVRHFTEHIRQDGTE